MCAVPCSKQTPTSTYRLDVHLSSGLACRFSEGFAVSLQMSILGTHGSNRALTQPMTVTAAGRDAITELNGRAAMDEVRLCMMFQPPADHTFFASDHVPAARCIPGSAQVAPAQVGSGAGQG